MRPVRFVLRASLLILIPIGLGILVPRPFFRPADAEPGESRTFYVLASAIHTDLAFPADDPDVRAAFGFIAGEGLDPDFPGVRFIVAGWGSRAFYINTPTWADLRPGPLARAFTLDSAVMHVSLAGAIDETSPAVRRITVPLARWRALLDKVSESFVRDGEDRPAPIRGAEYGEFDRFYEAHGTFNALVGCNVWTGRMLRVASLRTGFWTPLPVFLALSLDLHGV